MTGRKTCDSRWSRPAWCLFLIVSVFKRQCSNDAWLSCKLWVWTASRSLLDCNLSSRVHYSSCNHHSRNGSLKDYHWWPVAQIMSGMKSKFRLWRGKWHWSSSKSARELLLRNHWKCASAPMMLGKIRKDTRLWSAGWWDDSAVYFLGDTVDGRVDTCVFRILSAILDPGMSCRQRNWSVPQIY